MRNSNYIEPRAKQAADGVVVRPARVKHLSRQLLLATSPCNNTAKRRTDGGSSCSVAAAERCTSSVICRTCRSRSSRSNSSSNSSNRTAFTDCRSPRRKRSISRVRDEEEEGASGREDAGEKEDRAGAQSGPSRTATKRCDSTNSSSSSVQVGCISCSSKAAAVPRSCDSSSSSRAAAERCSCSRNCSSQALAAGSSAHSSSYRKVKKLMEMVVCPGKAAVDNEGRGIGEGKGRAETLAQICCSGSAEAECVAADSFASSATNVRSDSRLPAEDAAATAVSPAAFAGEGEGPVAGASRKAGVTFSPDRGASSGRVAGDTPSAGNGKQEDCSAGDGSGVRTPEKSGVAGACVRFPGVRGRQQSLPDGLCPSLCKSATVDRTTTCKFPAVVSASSYPDGASVSSPRVYVSPSRCCCSAVAGAQERRGRGAAALAASVGLPELPSVSGLPASSRLPACSSVPLPAATFTGQRGDSVAVVVTEATPGGRVATAAASSPSCLAAEGVSRRADDAAVRAAVAAATAPTSVATATATATAAAAPAIAARTAAETAASGDSREGAAFRVAGSLATFSRAPSARTAAPAAARSRGAASHEAAVEERTADAAGAARQQKGLPGARRLPQAAATATAVQTLQTYREGAPAAAPTPGRRQAASRAAARGGKRESEGGGEEAGVSLTATATSAAAGALRAAGEGIAAAGMGRTAAEEAAAESFHRPAEEEKVATSSSKSGRRGRERLSTPGAALPPPFPQLHSFVKSTPVQSPCTDSPVAAASSSRSLSFSSSFSSSSRTSSYSTSSCSSPSAYSPSSPASSCYSSSPSGTSSSFSSSSVSSSCPSASSLFASSAFSGSERVAAGCLHASGFPENGSDGCCSSGVRVPQQQQRATARRKCSSLGGHASVSLYAKGLPLLFSHPQEDLQQGEAEQQQQQEEGREPQGQRPQWQQPDAREQQGQATEEWEGTRRKLEQQGQTPVQKKQQQGEEACQQQRMQASREEQHHQQQRAERQSQKQTPVEGDEEERQQQREKSAEWQSQEQRARHHARELQQQSLQELQPPKEEKDDEHLHTRRDQPQEEQQHSVEQQVQNRLQQKQSGRQQKHLRPFGVSSPGQHATTPRSSPASGLATRAEGSSSASAAGPSERQEEKSTAGQNASDNCGIRPSCSFFSLHARSNRTPVQALQPVQARSEDAHKDAAADAGPAADAAGATPAADAAGATPAADAAGTTPAADAAGAIAAGADTTPVAAVGAAGIGGRSSALLLDQGRAARQLFTSEPAAAAASPLLVEKPFGAATPFDCSATDGTAAADHSCCFTDDDNAAGTLPASPAAAGSWDAATSGGGLGPDFATGAALNAAAAALGGDALAASTAAAAESRGAAPTRRGLASECCGGASRSSRRDSCSCGSWKGHRSTGSWSVSSTGGIDRIVLSRRRDGGGVRGDSRDHSSSTNSSSRSEDGGNNDDSRGRRNDSSSICSGDSSVRSGSGSGRQGSVGRSDSVRSTYDSSSNSSVRSSSSNSLCSFRSLSRSDRSASRRRCRDVLVTPADGSCRRLFEVAVMCGAAASGTEARRSAPAGERGNGAADFGAPAGTHVGPAGAAGAAEEEEAAGRGVSGTVFAAAAAPPSGVRGGVGVPGQASTAATSPPAGQHELRGAERAVYAAGYPPFPAAAAASHSAVGLAAAAASFSSGRSASSCSSSSARDAAAAPLLPAAVNGECAACSFPVGAEGGRGVGAGGGGAGAPEAPVASGRDALLFPSYTRGSSNSLSSTRPPPLNPDALQLKSTRSARSSNDGAAEEGRAAEEGPTKGGEGGEGAAAERRASTSCNVVDTLNIVSFNAGLLEYRLCGLQVYQNPPFTKRRLTHIPVSLLDTKGDIICLQEVYDDVHADFLVDAMRHSLPYVGRRTSGGRFALHNGLMVLSKYPIVHSRFHPFQDVTCIERLFGSKGMLEVSVDIPGVGTVAVFNIHLASGAVDPESPYVEALRSAEILQVLSACEDAGARGEIPIVVGDLNAAPDLCASNYKSFVERGWRDCWMLVHGNREMLLRHHLLHQQQMLLQGDLQPEVLEERQKQVQLELQHLLQQHCLQKQLLLTHGGAAPNKQQQSQTQRQPKQGELQRGAGKATARDGGETDGRGGAAAAAEGSHSRRVQISVGEQGRQGKTEEDRQGVGAGLNSRQTAATSCPPQKRNLGPQQGRSGAAGGGAGVAATSNNGRRLPAEHRQQQNRELQSNDSDEDLRDNYHALASPQEFGGQGRPACVVDSSSLEPPQQPHRDYSVPAKERPPEQQLLPLQPPAPSRRRDAPVELVGRPLASSFAAKQQQRQEAAGQQRRERQQEHVHESLVAVEMEVLASSPRTNGGAAPSAGTSSPRSRAAVLRQRHDVCPQQENGEEREAEQQNGPLFDSAAVTQRTPPSCLTTGKGESRQGAAGSAPEGREEAFLFGVSPPPLGDSCCVAEALFASDRQQQQQRTKKKKKQQQEPCGEQLQPLLHEGCGAGADIDDEEDDLLGGPDAAPAGVATGKSAAGAPDGSAATTTAADEVGEAGGNGQRRRMQPREAGEQLTKMRTSVDNAATSSRRSFSGRRDNGSVDRSPLHARTRNSSCHKEDVRIWGRRNGSSNEAKEAAVLPNGSCAAGVPAASSWVPASLGAQASGAAAGASAAAGDAHGVAADVLSVAAGIDTAACMASCSEACVSYGRVTAASAHATARYSAGLTATTPVSVARTPHSSVYAATAASLTGAAPAEGAVNLATGAAAQQPAQSPAADAAPNRVAAASSWVTPRTAAAAPPESSSVSSSRSSSWEAISRISSSRWRVGNGAEQVAAEMLSCTSREDLFPCPTTVGRQWSSSSSRRGSRSTCSTHYYVDGQDDMEAAEGRQLLHRQSANVLAAAAYSSPSSVALLQKRSSKRGAVAAAAGRKSNSMRSGAVAEDRGALLARDEDSSEEEEEDEEEEDLDGVLNAEEDGDAAAAEAAAAELSEGERGEGDWCGRADFTWDPLNPLNSIGPHAGCHGLRCDYVFLPPHRLARGLQQFVPVRGEILLRDPRVMVDAWCFGCLGQVMLVTLSDHYALKVQLQRCPFLSASPLTAGSASAFAHHSPSLLVALKEAKLFCGLPGLVLPTDEGDEEPDDGFDTQQELQQNNPLQQRTWQQQQLAGGESRDVKVQQQQQNGVQLQPRRTLATQQRQMQLQQDAEQEMALLTRGKKPVQSLQTGTRASVEEQAARHCAAKEHEQAGPHFFLKEALQTRVFTGRPAEEPSGRGCSPSSIPDDRSESTEFCVDMTQSREYGPGRKAGGGAQGRSPRDSSTPGASSRNNGANSGEEGHQRTAGRRNSSRENNSGASGSSSGGSGRYTSGSSLWAWRKASREAIARRSYVDDERVWLQAAEVSHQQVAESEDGGGGDWHRSSARQPQSSATHERIRRKSSYDEGSDAAAHLLYQECGV